MARAHTTAILEKVRADIQAGKYSQAEFLPSERSLADVYGTGRGVIRTVLRKLREENVIYLIPDKGAKISEVEKKTLDRILIRLSSGVVSKSSEGMGILAGVCMSAAENHTEVVMTFADGNEAVNEIAARYARGEVQGLVFLEGWDRKTMFSPLETAGVPYIIANQEQDDDALCCRMDFRSIGRRAGRYLFEKGHRNIGVIAGDMERYIYTEMLAGLRGALAEDEVFLEKEKILVETNEGIFPGMKKLLMSADRPTAFFAMRDNRARKFYDACRDLGIRVPEDISIISYDNITWPEAEHVGLTTLEQPVEKIGHEALEILKEWIVSGVKPESKKLYPTLIERSSVKDICY